jgi:hypothetical protein
MFGPVLLSVAGLVAAAAYGALDLARPSRRQA